jgi:hypothetical protein
MGDCFQLGGGKQGQYPPWWKGKRTVPVITNTANLAMSPDGEVKTGTHYALSTSVAFDELDDIMKENADSLKRVALAAGIAPFSTSSSSFADSGCTIHFFKNRDVFSSYRPLNKVVGQSSKEGTNFTILGTGNVELKVVFNGVEHTLTFHDALHAPDIMANLLSISKMDLAGWNAVFGDGRVQFFNKEKVEVFVGTLKNGLYLVNGSFNVSIPTALTARSLQSPADIDVWHRWFAHFGIS